MKKMSLSRIMMAIIATMLFLGMASSCSSDKEEEGIQLYEYTEAIGQKISELTTLKDNSEYGSREGTYPLTSKTILEDMETELREFLSDITAQNIATADVPAETERLLAKADAAIEEFKATILTEDTLFAAELHVNGSNGGYIDFGASDNFKLKSQFTVEMWVKFASFGDYNFVLTTFLDGGDGNRSGWGVNYVGGGNDSNMRMTYIMNDQSLYEPYSRIEKDAYLNKWFHLAYVWNEPLSNDDDPATFKMYVDGQVVKQENWNGHGAFVPNALTGRMVGFTRLNGSEEVIGTGEIGWTNGYIRYMHIWNSVKTKDQLQTIITNPDSVTGEESDLVCGWKFNQTVRDDQAIEDMTGKYTAKLVGDFEWIVQE